MNTSSKKKSRYVDFSSASQVGELLDSERRERALLIEALQSMVEAFEPPSVFENGLAKDDPQWVAHERATALLARLSES